MKQKIALLILILVGFLILVLALTPVIRSVKLKKHGISVESTVIQSIRHGGPKSRTTYEVTVSFSTSDGQKVTAKAIKSRSTSAGEKVIIWYDPANPQKIDFADSIGYNMRGVVFGGFFILLGCFLFFRLILSDAANNRLIRSGQKIDAEFVAVDRDERFRAGDKNPWIIRCKWIDNNNNKEYFFVSKKYTIDPAPYLNGRYHIDVYIDPADPGKYYMDTSFMPKGDNTIG